MDRVEKQQKQQTKIKTMCDKARGEISDLQDVLFHIKTLNEKLSNLEKQDVLNENLALIRDKAITALSKTNRIGNAMSCIIDDISKSI